MSGDCIMEFNRVSNACRRQRRKSPWNVHAEKLSCSNFSSIAVGHAQINLFHIITYVHEMKPITGRIIQEVIFQLPFLSPRASEWERDIKVHNNGNIADSNDYLRNQFSGNKEWGKRKWNKWCLMNIRHVAKFTEHSEWNRIASVVRIRHFSLSLSIYSNDRVVDVWWDN